MPLSTEFLRFHGILHYLVLAGDIGDKCGIFQCSSGHCNVCIHECHLGSDGRNTENIQLSLSEILPVNLVDRLYLSVAVTGDKYFIFCRVHRP